MKGSLPKGNVRPSLDTERVLTRIAAGDIRCGREAAREIAADAEEAYGAAFNGPPAYVLMMQLPYAQRRTPQDN